MVNIVDEISAVKTSLAGAPQLRLKEENQELDRCFSLYIAVYIAVYIQSLSSIRLTFGVSIRVNKFLLRP